MKFLEDLSQFSWVKGLAHEVPVNGPWDEQIPLVPITVVYNNTLYFILASVLSTPVELLLPRSLVSSSGPNLKAIIPFICSLTFWLHLTDLIIISVLKSWLKRLCPGTRFSCSFSVCSYSDLLGPPFFFNFFFLTLQAVSSELIFIRIQIISIVIIILAVITPASFLMEILLHWLALEQPSLDICSSLWHLIPDALSPGKINVGKIFFTILIPYSNVQPEHCINCTFLVLSCYA